MSEDLWQWYQSVLDGLREVSGGNVSEEARSKGKRKPRSRRERERGGAKSTGRSLENRFEALCLDE